MYKKIISIILILFITTSCSKKELLNENINTTIEENKNILIGINYPITGINTLDNIIKKDIEKIYIDFKNNYENFDSLEEKSELNIDYVYEIINDNYINIIIHVFIDSQALANPTNYIKTYVYDMKKQKLMTIKDLLKDDDMINLSSNVRTTLIKNYSECILLDEIKKLVTPTYSYPLFTFDTETISIYFNPAEVTASYCDIITVDLPISKFNLEIELDEIEEEKTIKEINIPNKVIDPTKKIVALTFDDGPSAYTKKIIEYLNKENASATFFILGNKVDIYKDTLKMAIEQGNELGNHSYNHKWLTKLEVDELLLQINKTQDILDETLNYKPTIFRPTYGSINNKIRKSIDLDIILWNVDTMDWKYKSIDKIVSKATKNIKDGDIILMHDTYERTYKALTEIIPILKEQGFEFVTISELKEIQKLRNEITD